MSRGPGGPHGNVYTVLRDVLGRPGEIDAERVHYRPSAAQKRYLEACVDCDQIDSPVGPDAPRVTVRWGQQPLRDEFRIDYADPSVEFHCRWHRDDDHPEHGDVHFQYEHPGLDAPSYEAATFDSATPPRILWEALDELFADVLPTHVGPLYDDS